MVVGISGLETSIDERRAMNKDIRDAKTKLLADFINRVAVVSVSAGVATPIAGIIFVPAAAGGVNPTVAAVGGLSFFVAAIVLHLIARSVLNGIGK